MLGSICFFAYRQLGDEISRTECAPQEAGERTDEDREMQRNKSVG